MKEKKTAKYFELQERFETEVLRGAPLMWQLERAGEFNSFTVSAYMIGGKIVLTQNWWNGNGIHLYLPDGEITFQGSRQAIA